ncbi:MAG: carboxymuconolactone decarboxylase family protein [Saprospiraceae bacterium]|nr:carboxymuconolactone decarboxylase family protein [Saprospiraceae bacterium]
MGFVPNMYNNMAINPALLDAYSYAYQSFRQNAGFTSVEQEVVFLSAAYANNCEYCMAAHSFVGDNMTKVPTEVTDAIRAGIDVPDEKLNALADFTRKMTKNRGTVKQETLDNFLNAGYTPSHAQGVIAGIAVKTMSNYSNHLTSPVLDDVFAGRVWSKPTKVKNTPQ